MKENGQFRHFGLCDEAGEDKLSPHGCRKQQQVASEEPTVGEIILQAEKIKNVNEPLQTKKKKKVSHAGPRLSRGSADPDSVKPGDNMATVQWEAPLFFFPPYNIGSMVVFKKRKEKDGGKVWKK